jgi:hypothetical protein
VTSGWWIENAGRMSMMRCLPPLRGREGMQVSLPSARSSAGSVESLPRSATDRPAFAPPGDEQGLRENRHRPRRAVPENDTHAELSSVRGRFQRGRSFPQDDASTRRVRSQPRLHARRS